MNWNSTDTLNTENEQILNERYSDTYLFILLTYLVCQHDVNTRHYKKERKT